MDPLTRTPTPGPGGLSAYDPEGFALLAAVYGGTHPSLADADGVGKRMRPLRGVAFGSVGDGRGGGSGEGGGSEGGGGSDGASDETPRAVDLEFDHRECDCAWRVYWVDEHGSRVPYGKNTASTRS